MHSVHLLLRLVKVLFLILNRLLRIFLVARGRLPKGKGEGG